MKIKLLLIFAIALLPLLSATIPEFLDSVQDIQILIDENESQINFNLDISNTSFNLQEIEVEAFDSIIIIPIDLFQLLEGMDFKCSIGEGEDYFVCEEIYISGYAQGILDMVMPFYNISFSVDDINNNITLFNEFLSRHSLPMESDRQMIMQKDGNSYSVWNNKGYGQVKEEYMNEIENRIEEGFYSISLDNILGLVPFEFSKYLPTLVDTTYSLSLDLSNVNLTSGDYSVSIEISHDNKTYSKEVSVELENLVIEDQEDEVVEDEEIVEDVTPSSPSGRKKTRRTPIIIIQDFEPIEKPKPKEPIDLDDKPLIIEPEEKSWAEENKGVIIICIIGINLVLLIAILCIALKGRREK